MARWRFPSLTIHKIVTTGSSQGSVIPHKARGVISMRLVPDQDLSQMVSIFKQTLHEQFTTFNSDNKLDVIIEHQADWWLGDPENRGFKALERAVADEWGIPPIYIREVPFPFSWNRKSLTLCRGVRFREYDGWKRSLGQVRLIFLWDRRVIMRIWWMNGCGYSIWREDREYYRKYLQSCLRNRTPYLYAMNGSSGSEMFPLAILSGVPPMAGPLTPQSLFFYF